MSHLPEIQEQIAALMARIEVGPSSVHEQHRLQVSLKLLEEVAKQPKGPGAYCQSLPAPEALANEGTLMLRWRTGEQGTDLLLVELVGGVLDNRLSIRLNSDASFSTRVLDDVGAPSVVRSSSAGANRLSHVSVTWTSNEINLWVQGQRVGSARIQNKLRRLGPYFFVGSDIDGLIGATSVRQGYVVDGRVGFNLEREGVWRGKAGWFPSA